MQQETNTPTPVASPTMTNQTQNAALAVERVRLESANKGGASWFFIIAVLSIVNSIIVLSGSNWNFIVGLGATQMVDGAVGAAAKNFSGTAAGVITAIALLINVIIAGIYFVIGIFARKRHSWAYITGMIFYGLDALIFLLAAAWVNIAFHIFALFCIFKGLKACKDLAAMDSMEKTQS